MASGDLSEVQRLLAAGANPASPTGEGHTALRVAAILGHDDIYSLLASPRDEHLEWLLDQALEDTFPASDPIAVSPSPKQLAPFIDEPRRLDRGLEIARDRAARQAASRWA